MNTDSQMDAGSTEEYYVYQCQSNTKKSRFLNVTVFSQAFSPPLAISLCQIAYICVVSEPWPSRSIWYSESLHLCS